MVQHGKHPGPHSTRDGGCRGDAQHQPFPQAGSRVRATASCLPHPHGIPALVSHQLPCGSRLLDQLPAAWLKFTAKPGSKLSPSIRVICFLSNLSFFF